MTETSLPGYVRVVFDGAPELGPLIRAFDRLQRSSQAWTSRCVLLDRRAMGPLPNLTVQALVGDQIASCLSHLRRIASLVGVGERTDHSETIARRRGVNLRVFENEEEAVHWLLAAGPGTAPA
ncbi:MAG TPA: hypothetical protein VFE82_04550 [Ramlibacter sp.]|uniref:hypothetical protein n=1 Tax=Ramlibacter sp. TaxID=1917967 RepID=UPI002D2D6D1E|nr:hypothetical protein [Ramlibacter sp.]HZY17726.1 hypothetical protein [Ramlibacter sp.]